jgi:hypothetical protein
VLLICPLSEQMDPYPFTANIGDSRYFLYARWWKPKLVNFMMSLWLCTSHEIHPDPNMALDYGTLTIYTVHVNLTDGALSRFLLSSCSTFVF